MSKKLYSLLILACAAFVARADTQVVDGIEWTYVVSGGEATVGNGTNAAVAVSTTGSLEIPAFLGGCPVTGIGDYAFQYCMISGVTIPSSVKCIGGFAFSNCRSLTGITIPEGVTEISCCAFQYCTSLISVSLPSTVREIGFCAFSYSPNLYDMSVAAGNTAYKVSSGCLLTFDGTRLVRGLVGESVDIPEGVTTICSAFCGMNDTFKSVRIPSTVESIEIASFAECVGLTNVVIPAGVSSIGVNVFAGDPNLKAIEVEEGNDWYSSSHGALYNAAKTELISAPHAVNAFEIEPSATTIWERAFSGNINLTSIVVPSNVMDVGYLAFEGCTSLTSVIFEGNSPLQACRIYCSTPESLVTYVRPDSTGWQSVGSTELPETWPVGDYDARAIRHYQPGIKPDGMYFEVADGVEWAYSVTNGEARITGCNEGLSGYVDIPGTLGGCPVVDIWDYAFVYNDELVSVTFPPSLRVIHYAAFAGCSSLKYVTFLGNEEDVEIREYAFADTPYENGWRVPFLVISGDEVTGLSWQLGHDDNGCLTNGCVLIPQGIASVRAHALEDFNGLEKVVIPSSVESVGDFAFAWCPDLESVVIVDTDRTTCSRTAFCGTPWKLKTEGWNLPFVQAPGSGGVLDIRYSTVYEQTPCAVTNGVLYIPEGVTNVPSELFDEEIDVKLTTIVCPSTLKSVASEGLVACPYLQLVELRSTDIRIASDAFGSDEETIYRVEFVLNAGSEVLRGWNLAPTGTTPSVFPYTYSDDEAYEAFLIGPGYDALPLTAELKVAPGEISEFVIPDMCSVDGLKAVIAGVSGAMWNDFADCPYLGNGYAEVTSCRCLTCPAIIDVEKTAAQDADDYACYYLPQINMAYWGGWIPTDVYPSEDFVADVFREQGYFDDIVNWVSTNYDPGIDDAIVHGPTSVVASAFNQYIVDNLSDGRGLIMLGTAYASHGITCCGYACDETKQVSDAGYLRGLFIVDSDNDMNNNGGGAAAPNRITYCKLDESDPEDMPMIADIWGLGWDYVFAEFALSAKSGTKPDGIYTETVDGVEWTFTVKNGEASIGGGAPRATAVDVATAGDIVIPSVLGGCPEPTE